MKAYWIAVFCCLSVIFFPASTYSQSSESPVPSSTPESVAPSPAAPGDEDVAPRPTLLDQNEAVQRAVAVIQSHFNELPQEPEHKPTETLVLDLQGCVQKALEQNAQIAIAEDSVRAARARIGQARSAMFPQVKATYGVTHTEMNEREQSGLMSLLGGGSGGFGGFGLGGLGGMTGDPLVDIGLPIVLGIGGSIIGQKLTPKLTPDDTLETTQVSFSQVVYAGGQIRAAINASKYLAESEEWKKSAKMAEIEFAAKQAYYDVLLTDALVRVAEGSVRTFERNLADAEQMFDVGMISHYEVTRARTELGARKADLVAAVNARRLALANLHRILFVPQEVPIEVKPSFDWQPPSEPLANLVAAAYEKRPEILALQKAILAAEENLKRVKGEYKPRIGVNADYKNTEGGGVSIPDGWTFTVGAQWELVAGGRRKFERVESQAQIDNLKHQLADVERLIELDVTQAYIQIQDAMAKVESERGTVELAQEGLRLSELRFKEGVGTQTEVLQAELALTGAETKLIQSLRDYVVASAALERATGNNWFSRTTTETASVTP